MSVFPAWVDALPTLSNGFKWMPGIPGGIPAGTLDTTLTAGQMTTAGINSALAAASARGSPTNIRVVQMPAGTFGGLGYITPQNYVILRGAGAWGAGRTRLNFNTGAGAGGIASAQPTWPATTNITGSLAIGATQAVVASASTLAVGDVVQIDQLDDLSYVAILDAVYMKRTPWWTNHGPTSAGGLRSVTSLHVVTAINGTTVTFDPPTRIAYDAAFTPQMWRVARRGTSGIWYSGLENFSMAGPHDDSAAVAFQAGAYCWVKGVETDGISTGPGIINDHINFSHQFRSEIRGCYCHHTDAPYYLQSGGAAYGININTSSSDCLVIDSIAVFFCKGIQSNCCGPGNVVAYCYSDNTSANGGDWMDGAISASHQSYSHNMLFEGCYGSNLAVDATHGNSGRILFFRSYGHGQARDLNQTGFIRAANVDGWSRETAFIGCVLNGPGSPTYEVNGCTDINAFVNSGATIFRVGQCVWGEGDWNEVQDSRPPTNNAPQGGDGRRATFTTRCQELLYRHGNWDKAHNGQTWDAGNADHVLPASAFLAAKPSDVFGTYSWPAVDPSTGLAGVGIPAQIRYDAGTPFAAPPSSTPISIPVTLSPGINTIRVAKASGGPSVLSALSLAYPPPIALTAAAGGHAAGSGVLTRKTGLVGAAAGSAGASGRLNFPVAGAAAGHAGGQGTLQVQPPLQGTAGGQAGASGSLVQLQPGPVRVLTLTAGDGSVLRFSVPIVQLTAGDGSGVGIGVYPSGYYGPALSLSGTAAAHAGASAVPGQLQHLAGSVGAHADAAGSLGDVTAAGGAAGKAGADASLKVDLPISGEADAHAGATAVGPQLPIPLAGSAAGQADASGEAQKVPLAGKAEGTAQGSAELRVDVPLAGVAEGKATAAILPHSTNAAPRLQLRLYGPRLSLRSYPGPDVRLKLYGPRIALRLREED